MDLGIAKKTALVTGGSQGIGFGIAQALANEGAHTIIASRNPKNVDAAVSKLKTTSSQVEGISIDMSDEKGIRSEVSKLLTKNTIDILIINAGGPVAGNMADLPLARWDEGYNLLVRSAIALSETVIPKMKEQAWGRILLITSSAAFQLIPKLSISSTFRAGLRAWTRSMAKEVGRDGILINNLLPGPVNTQRLQELKTKSPEFYQSMASDSGIGRIGEPLEIGKVAAFLCSNANTYLTGQDIIVDGGSTKVV